MPANNLKIPRLPGSGYRITAMSNIQTSREKASQGQLRRASLAKQRMKIKEACVRGRDREDAASNHNRAYH